MAHAIIRILCFTALLFAVTATSQASWSGTFPEITLSTEPQQVREGQAFELVWRVSSDNAEILQVFVDASGSPGPEYTWNHDGAGAFETRVKQVADTPGPKD